MPREVIAGLRDLQIKLKNMPDKVQNKILRNAATFAVNPLVQEAKRSVPVSDRNYLARTYRGTLIAPGFGKRSIAKKVKLYQDGKFAKAMVGVKPEAYYLLQFVERGTSKQPKQPWLEPAYRKTRRKVLTRFQEQMKKKILESAKGKR
jgi:HK97 gp10 family phage protein